VEPESEARQRLMDVASQRLASATHQLVQLSQLHADLRRSLLLLIRTLAVQNTLASVTSSLAHQLFHAATTTRH
jgi:hypothetical protein